MDDALTWLIVAVFYAPLHFAGPAAFVAMTTSDRERRQRLLRYAVIESAVSMLAAFTLAIALAATHLGLALAILLVSMSVPYLGQLVHRVSR